MRKGKSEKEDKEEERNKTEISLKKFLFDFDGDSQHEMLPYCWCGFLFSGIFFQNKFIKSWSAKCLFQYQRILLLLNLYVIWNDIQYVPNIFSFKLYLFYLGMEIWRCDCCMKPISLFIIMESQLHNEQSLNRYSSFVYTVWETRSCYC